MAISRCFFFSALSFSFSWRVSRRLALSELPEDEEEEVEEERERSERPGERSRRERPGV